MSSAVLMKSYAQPPFCKREILRYAGCKEAEESLEELIDDCIGEIKDRLVYRVCYRCLNVKVRDDICDFGEFSIKSENLALNLEGSHRVILFAATVGVETDRLIAKYGRISPSKALIFQAIGAERIEALCDTFCEDIAREMGVGLKPRFSPGYGDLPLESQRDIFSLLDCGRRIGLFLNDSMLMSPSKSVTAFAGITDKREKTIWKKCGGCNKSDCIYRGAL